MIKKKNHFYFLFTLLIIFFQFEIINFSYAINIEKNQQWPMFHYNIQRTGRCSFGVNPQNSTPIVKWKYFTTNMGSLSSPAIDDNGILYIGTYDLHKSFFAINKNGTEKWHFDAGDLVRSSPAIGSDGTIYFGADNGNLYALLPNGTLKWCINLGLGWVISSPVIDSNGVIYAASTASSMFYAIYPNGTLKWSFQTNDWIYSSPAISEDGTIYFGANDHYLYAISPNGSMKWRYSAGQEIQSTPSIDSAGNIYFGSWDDNLYALYPNGTLKWKINAGGTIDDSSPAISENGTIYIGTLKGDILSVSPGGHLNWRYRTGDEIYSSPAIDRYGIIYCGSCDGYLYACNPNGTLHWRFNLGYPVMSSPAIDENGTTYIACWGPYIYALSIIYDNHPSKPSINGQVNGKINYPYNYTIVSTDIDNDNISYYVNWGDGTTTNWTTPTHSSQQVILSHTWQKRGSYTIKTKAQDEHGMESDWATLTVKMPYQPPNFPILHWLLDRFPNAFPLLHRLFGY